MRATVMRKARDVRVANVSDAALWSNRSLKGALLPKCDRRRRACPSACLYGRASPRRDGGSN
jgi:hypothetical protein